MICIIAYDISDNKTRNKMARFLLGMGVRLQKSVFAVEFERHAFKRITRQLKKICGEEGQIAIIRLCAGCQKKAIHLNDVEPLFYLF